MPTYPSIEFDCTHDSEHPEHLVCVQKREAVLGNPLTNFFFRRYHAHYHKKRKSGKTHLAVDLLLASSVIVLVFFNGVAAFVGPKILAKTIDVTVRPATDVITAGAENLMTVSYVNNAGHKLSRAEMRVVKNNMFSFVRYQGTDFEQEGELLRMGTVEKGQKGSFAAVIIPTNGLNSQNALVLELTGVDPKGKKRTVTAATHYSLKASTLTPHLNLEAQAVTRQRFSGSVIIQNTGGQIISNATARLDVPDSFVLERFDGKRLDLTKDEIILPFSGRFLPNAKGSKVFTARVFGRMGKEDLLLGQASGSVSVASPTLSLRVTQVSPSSSLLPGGTYTFKLEWGNTGTETLSNVKAGVKVSSPYLKSKSLSSQDGSRVDGEIILWTANHKKNLSSLSKHQKGEGLFAVTLLPSINLSPFKLDHDFSVIVQPFATYTLQGREISVSGSPLKAELSSQSSLQAFGRYYSQEGDQIGRGPLPPRVGKTTRYQIFLVAKGGIHPLKDAKVIGVLPKSVEWTGLAPIQGDSLSFDNSTRTVSWNIGTIPIALGKEPETVGSVFEVALTPHDDQTGKIQELIMHLSISSIDSLTGARISANAKPVSTHLYLDKKAQGKGVVQP